GDSCGPRINIHRKRERVPFKYRQRVPDVHETSAKASGGFNRVKRGTAAYDELKINVNPDIIFKDDRGTSDNRRMTKRCERKLENLAVLVRDLWLGDVKVRVIRAYDDGTIRVKHRRRYPFPDLHYAGRAVDITTSDTKRDKNPMLARLAYEAGFDWVAYESRGFIHASVQSEESGTSDERSGCFHSNSTVELQNGTKIKMTDLKIGDKVASMDNNGRIVYSPVIMFFHRNPTLRATFQIISTQNHRQKLVITPKHFIYKLNKHTQRETVDYAKWTAVGDEVYVRNRVHPNGPFTTQRVTDVTKVDMSGVFAPLTETGTIVVDDVVVSCYAVFPNDAIAHWSMLPVRIVTRFYPNFFKTNEDIHWYPRSLFKLYKMFRRLTMREV
ncbi:hypothetical protein QZH41_019898, partial [Actinostola sp. cb2023]